MCVYRKGEEKKQFGTRNVIPRANNVERMKLRLLFRYTQLLLREREKRTYQRERERESTYPFNMMTSSCFLGVLSVTRRKDVRSP